MSLAIALVMILGVTVAYLVDVPVVGLEGAPSPDNHEERAGSTKRDTTPDVDGTTTLLTSKESTGFWEREVIYDWSIEKNVLESEAVSVSDAGRLGYAMVPKGQSVTIDYLIKAERCVATDIEHMGVRGYVCVKNVGSVPTENLAIVDHIQIYDENVCSYVDVAVFEVDTSSRPVLAPGEEHAYFFEYAFDAVAASEYCNLACVSITNYEGFDGVAHAVPAYDPFTMPAEPCLIEIDETALIVDEMWCPENFQCTATDSGPWILHGSDDILISVDAANLCAGCEQERCLWNKATLTELDCCEVREDCAYVNLVTGPCPCQTTISVEKSAELIWEKKIEYNWTVEKSFEVLGNGQEPDSIAVQTADIILDKGQTARICYTIDADRKIVDIVDKIVLEGYVRVRNTNCCPTEGLTIADVFVVEYNGIEYSLDFEISTEEKPVLGSGERHDYGYSVDVTEFLLGILIGPNDDTADQQTLSMVNRAYVGITNFRDQNGLYFIEDEIEVALPEPEVEYIDETATLTDLETFPRGFDMDIIAGPWYLEGPETIRFCKNITNEDAECGRIYYVNDTARLVEDDTGEIRKDKASVVIETPECDRGITLSISRTVNYGWNKTIRYDWSLAKGVNQTALTLDGGETGYLKYTLTATRSIESEDVTVELWGTVSVTNSGPLATEDLQVFDTVYINIGGEWIELQAQDLTAQKDILAGGETFVYRYNMDITQDILDALGEENMPSDLSLYAFRNTASATVTNYHGHPGERWGVKATGEFNIATAQVEEVDETATLNDVFDDIPPGFDVDLFQPGTWHLDENDLNAQGVVIIEGDVTVTNEDAECGGTYYLNNTARLVEDDSKDAHEDEASVVINTPECECGGCTYTIGYWKNHDGSGPQDDKISPLIQAAGGTIWLGTPNGAKSVAVTTAAQAGSILANAGGANKFNQLYAQMLAAKLNILNGACDLAVDELIDTVDAFLAEHDAGDWGGLSKSEQTQVTNWAKTFDDYNNGIIGPGHCD